MAKILIIIPCYNESESILKVIDRIEKLDMSVDYIVVNDCSTDNTLDILKKANANYLDLPVNLGIGGAVQSGYKYAKENDYDIAIQLDGDGQHDPQFIAQLIQPILDCEADVCIGSRFIEKQGFQSSALRRLGINILSTCISVFYKEKVYDVTSGFRAVNKNLIDIYAKDYAQDYPEPEALATAILSHQRIKEVPVIMNERMGGQSSIHSFKSVYYMLKVSLAIIFRRFSLRKEK